jgi:proteasome lid subunit RPN8/RPN11
MSDDMHFGELEESQPEQCLRPDQNRHYAVVTYGKPGDQELPIFVDLDVLLDMENHAATDKTVELGGVMLGGHFEDASGQPFVLISDSLRAEHYESTKGSFKFTHETWENISRQRDEFPPDLQMAGWYHTHPDWGVFLSGMDMFICDHFFNKPLDVAYVIDPCRLDRAFFQWTGKPGERIRRTGGFYVTASRFRQVELEQTVQALEGKIPMPTYSAGPGGSPVIHVQSPPPPPKPAWEGVAMVGMLSLQFCLLALIAWKLLTPPAVENDALTRQIEKLLEARQEAEFLAARNERDLEVMDRVLAEVKGTDRSLVEDFRDESNKRKDLELALRNSQEVQKQAQRAFQASLKKLQDENAGAAASLESLQAKLEVLEADRTALGDELKQQEKTRQMLEERLNSESARIGPLSWPPTPQTWWLIGGGAVLALMAGMAGFWYRGQAKWISSELPFDESAASAEQSAADAPRANSDSGMAAKVRPSAEDVAR